MTQPTLALWAKETQKCWWVISHWYPDRDQTQNPGTCPDRELMLQPTGSEGSWSCQGWKEKVLQLISDVWHGPRSRKSWHTCNMYTRLHLINPTGLFYRGGTRTLNASKSLSRLEAELPTSSAFPTQAQLLLSSNWYSEISSKTQQANSIMLSTVSVLSVFHLNSLKTDDPCNITLFIRMSDYSDHSLTWLDSSQ